MTSLSRVALLPLLAGMAGAQSFNLDVGPNTILSPAPSSTYGAAAAQPGHWMEFKDPFTVVPIEDLTGAPTSVTLESDVSNWINIWPTVIPDPDAQALMEDAQWLPNLDVPVTWLFTGLENGDYDLYTYAADPASSSIQSQITVTGSADPPQVVGSVWTGGHVLGETYARHRVTVTDGTLEVVAMGFGPQPNNSGILNGFQLVLDDGSTGPIGTSYCGPANTNSTGQSAEISAFGSDVVAQNDVTLTASQMPTNQFGYFLTSETQDFIPFPGGSQGNLCLGGNIGRYKNQIQNSGGGGSFSIAIDLASVPVNPPQAVIAGETWNFTCWYRDVNPSSTSNFTDGVSILFL